MYVMRSTRSNQSAMQRSSKTKQFAAGIYLLDCQPRAPPDSVNAAYSTLFIPTCGNPPFSLPRPRPRPLSRFPTSARPLVVRTPFNPFSPHSPTPSHFHLKLTPLLNSQAEYVYHVIAKRSWKVFTTKTFAETVKNLQFPQDHLIHLYMKILARSIYIFG